jgi:hypothetical protein
VVAQGGHSVTGCGQVVEQPNVWDVEPFRERVCLHPPRNVCELGGLVADWTGDAEGRSSDPLASIAQERLDDRREPREVARLEATKVKWRRRRRLSVVDTQLRLRSTDVASKKNRHQIAIGLDFTIIVIHLSSVLQT